MPAPNATDTNFERTFADLAFARMKDRAPSLLDHLVGFQLIDKDDEDTHAVGVFGFKIGSEWVYAPVFFINGELKGHELLFIKGQDAFVPMTEEWTNYILNRRPSILGENEQTPRNQLGLRQPDFDIFSRVPFMGSKYASVRRGFKYALAHVADWAKPFLDVFLSSPRDVKYASLDKRLSLPHAIKALGKQAAFTLINSMKCDEKFADAVLTFYDIKDLLKAAQAAEDKIPFDEAPYRDTPSKVVVITRSDDLSAVTQDMSESDKTKLMKDQYVVKDERSKDQKSRLYKTELAATFSGPDGNGVYPVVQPDGALKELIIVDHPIKLGCQSRWKDFVVAIDPKNNKYGNYHPSDILTGAQSKPISKLSGLVNPESLKYDDVAILVGPNNDATSVFSVNAKSTNADGITELRIWGHTEAAPASSKLITEMRTHMPDDPSYRSSEIHTIVLTGKESDRLSHVGESLFVPASWKALVIRPGKPQRPPAAVSYADAGTNLVLGNVTDVITAITKTAVHRNGAHKLQLLTDGIQFNVVLDGNHGPRLSKIATLKHLIVNHGLGQDEAEILLKEAHPRQARAYFIKYAQGSAPVPAYFPDPPMGMEAGISVPVQYPQLNIQNLTPGDLSVNREFYRDDRTIDESAKRFAQTAASQGQKEVLDTSVVSGLVHTMETDSLVDSYIGDLLLGLDRIGRILFMFYWHNEKFKDRYGQQDMVDLEDNLRSVFKSLGELSLFLKQKTIEPDKADSSEVELSEVLA